MSDLGKLRRANRLYRAYWLACEVHTGYGGRYVIDAKLLRLFKFLRELET